MRRNVTSESGASAVEYGLIVVAIAAVIVAIVFALGGLTLQMFTDTCDSLESGFPAGSSSC